MSAASGSLIDAYKRLPIRLVRGAGAWVYGDDGRAYLDMYGGHAVAATGHGHPRLVEALRAQLGRLVFYSNVVHLEHQEEAAALLLEALPRPLARAFFVNSGAEAVENALKLARQATGRRRVVSFAGGFHGRTLGAAAGNGTARYRQGLAGELPFYDVAPFGETAGVEALLAAGDVAAVLVEPIQSLAGVRTAPGAFFQELRRLCDRHGALLVYDELQTGFGRTGTFAYAPRHGVVPDLATFGKGTGSGFPVAVCVATDAVSAAARPGDLGSTFGGGPLACLAVRTTLEILRDEGVIEGVQRRSGALRAGLAACQGVAEVRGEGYLLGVRLADLQPSAAAAAQAALLAGGVLSGTSDDPAVLRLMPPLTLTDDEIAVFLTRFEKALSQCRS